MTSAGTAESAGPEVPTSAGKNKILLTIRPEKDIENSVQDAENRNIAVIDPGETPPVARLTVSATVSKR